MGQADLSGTMPVSLTQNNCLSGQAVRWHHKVARCVLRVIYTTCQIISRLSTRIHESTLPQLLLKQRRVRRQVRKRATLIGSQRYRDKPFGFHGTIGIERISRLLGIARLFIEQTFIGSTKSRELSVLTAVDDNGPAFPTQKHSLTHLHLADVDFFSWNLCYGLRPTSKRRKKHVENREYTHVSHQFDGNAKFESSLLCCFCRLLHLLGFPQFPVLSVRHS